MKRRTLHTVPDLIVTDYTITQLGTGTFLHQFHPATTNTLYMFEGNATPRLKEGSRYNMGYDVGANHRNMVDPSTITPADVVKPLFSYHLAKEYAQQEYDIERENNDRRVAHSGSDDYYWGKKYAWRMFGACIPKGAFYTYLEEIGHPSVPCVTSEEGYPSSNSTAYAETGLDDAVYNLITSAVIVKNGPYYRSPLYTKKFQIEGPSAITHKK